MTILAICEQLNLYLSPILFEAQSCIYDDLGSRLRLQFLHRIIEWSLDRILASHINVHQYVHRAGKKGESHFPRVDREVESEKKVMTCRVRLSFSFCSFLSFRFFPTLCIHSLPSAHSIYISGLKLLASFIVWYIRFPPGFAGTKLKCTVHVALPKRPMYQF